MKEVEQVRVLREALTEIVDDYADRFDLSSPSTNPGIKHCVANARAALAATAGGAEPKAAPSQEVIAATAGAAASPAQAGEGVTLALLAKEYRPTMPSEVLHLWARDGVAALAAQDATGAAVMEGAPAVPAASEVARVLGYLEVGEKEIVAWKPGHVWGNTMWRAAALIRQLVATPAPGADSKGPA